MSIDTLDIPVETRERPNPVEPTPESVSSGRRVFQSQCTACHGSKGDGRGTLARQLRLKPPNFTKRKQQQARTDGELFYILTEGHDAMPGQGDRWDERLRWDLVNYIRSLASRER